MYAHLKRDGFFTVRLPGARSQRPVGRRSGYIIVYV
jgi:hypothetical protein